MRSFRASWGLFFCKAQSRRLSLLSLPASSMPGEQTLRLPESQKLLGASRCDVHIRGGGGHVKADLVREVVWILLYQSVPNANKGRGSNNLKFSLTSFMEAPYGIYGGSRKRVFILRGLFSLGLSPFFTKSSTIRSYQGITRGEILSVTGRIKHI